MSRIDELIQKLCPSGVEYVTLLELLGSIPRGRRLTKAALAEDGQVPVYHGGLEPIGFHDQSNSRAMTVMVINTGASSGTVGWSEVPFWCSDGCFALPHSERVESKYLYYSALSNQKFFTDRVRRAGIPTLAADSVLSLRIPVPPLEVQREIVRVLDKFTQLEAELEAELEARRSQYEHYLSHLFEGLPEGTPLKTFSDVGVFSRGGGPQKKDFIDSGVGCIHYGQIYTHYGVSATVTNKFVSAAAAARAKGAYPGDVVIAVTSENDDDLARSVAWLGSDWVAVSNHTLIFTSEMDPRFVSYYLRSRQFDSAKRKYISGTKVKSLPLRAFENIQIPVPPMVEQVRLADLLDTFDALVNDISVGLPAELAARRKQYDHYRDRLLTFKELAS